MNPAQIKMVRPAVALVTSLCVGLLLAISVMPQSATAADCQNETIRAGQTSATFPEGTVHLPECMALEMVSPPKKFQQRTSRPVFSPDGERVLFESLAALAETEGLQNVWGDSYVAVRGGSGWTSHPTSPPHASDIAVGGAKVGGPYAFTPYFDRWLSFGATKTEASAGTYRIYSGGLDTAFSSLTPLLVPIDSSGNWQVILSSTSAHSNGSSSDLSTTVFQPLLRTTAYLPGDPRVENHFGTTGFGNKYVASRDADGQGRLELLARDDEGTVHGGRCGTQLGGRELNQGAISADGSRIYFSARPNQPYDEALPFDETASPECDTENPLRIMRRERTDVEVEISELFPSDPAEPGDDLYQAASEDGTRVYLATTRQLVGSDHDTGSRCSSDLGGASAGCDLYLFDSTRPPGERLTQVSAPGPGGSASADVLASITAASTDGSHTYFVAKGVLTTEPNPEGDIAEEGEPNLYAYTRDGAHPTGRTAFVGTLDAADRENLWGTDRTGKGTAYAVPMIEGGGDGHVLLLASKAPLTDDDDDGGFADVFRYDAGLESLVLVSKSTLSGGSDDADMVVAGGATPFALNTNRALEGRWASESGERVVFSTTERLASDSADGELHPYIWSNGDLARLPASPLPATVSVGGGEVGFSTTEALLPTDGDTASDVYVARTGGGFPSPPAPDLCDPSREGSCRQPSNAAPGGPAIATEAVTAGNVQTPPACRRGKVRRRGKCVKPRDCKGKRIRRYGRCVKRQGKRRHVRRATHHDRRIGK